MEVILNNNRVPVILNRKKIKNIYFRFDKDMNLVINMSKYVSERELLKLIEQNKKSLENMMKKVSKKQEKESEFWYLGNSYVIVYDEDIKKVEFSDGFIYVKNEDMLNRFLKKQIRDIFIYEVEEYKKIIKTPPFTLKFRKMKTRWGVCNYKLKTITLNTELIRYKKDDLRYVIVHEMCHFYHHNHGKDFWKLVEVYNPNYKEARKDLKE